MYSAVSATIACCIHRTHGGDDTFQPIHYPSPRITKEIVLWPVCPKICDKGKLYYASIGTKKQTQEPTGKMHNKQMKGERE